MPCGNKKILITGATGLIGKELIAPLQERGFDIYALTIDKNNPNNGVHYIPCNIFNHQETQKICSEVKAEYLLNMAWCTTGDYLSSDMNYDFLTAGVNLLKHFIQNGGKRIVFAGTCFEYKFKGSPLKETDALDASKTTYTFCKDILHKTAAFYCLKHQISFAYGRIFYVYGRHENNTRLTGMLIDKLSKNEQVIIKSGNLQKDYMYAKDIAGAFAAVLDSGVKNEVNICTGKAISIKDFASKIAKEMYKEHLLVFKDEPSNQPPLIVGDNTRLTKEVGYQIKYNLDNAIKEILDNYYGNK